MHKISGNRVCSILKELFFKQSSKSSLRTQQVSLSRSKRSRLQSSQTEDFEASQVEPVDEPVAESNLKQLSDVQNYVVQCVFEEFIRCQVSEKDFPEIARILIETFPLLPYSELVSYVWLSFKSLSQKHNSREGICSVRVLELVAPLTSQIFERFRSNTDPDSSRIGEKSMTLEQFRTSFVKQLCKTRWQDFNCATINVLTMSRECHWLSDNERIAISARIGHQLPNVEIPHLPTVIYNMLLTCSLSSSAQVVMKSTICSFILADINNDC